MFTLAVTPAPALLALSVQVPKADCPAPSEVNKTGAEQKSTPDRLSKPLNDTVTLVLFQPLPLGPGDGCACVKGGIRSILSNRVRGSSTLPALSAPLYVRVAMPSGTTVTEAALPGIV